jgi:citronellol/citronellal dehydrogenase
VSYRSVFRAGLFAGRVVVVTGGGSGIGRCTAHELASLGAVVALVGRDEGRLARVVEEIAASGARAGAYPCDIREEAAVQATVGAILAAHGRIDGLVNNAGGQFPAPLASISARGWDAVVRTNLTGGFLFARECYTQWLADHAGDACGIVNLIADMWQGMPGMGHSGAARAGMLNFTETAALEWAPLRVDERHGPLSARDGAAHPLSACTRAAASPRHRKRGVGGHRVPALAGRFVHLGRLPACRWRRTERQARMAAGWQRQGEPGV